jgi:hypothetical protein
VKRRLVESRLRKQKKMIHGKFKSPNYGELGHRENNPKCSVMVQRKDKCLIATSNVIYTQHDYHSH